METKIRNVNKNSEGNIITISYKYLQWKAFIYGKHSIYLYSIFMESLLSNPVDNLAERIHKNRCKRGHSSKKKKKMEACGIKYNNCECFLECINIKDDLIEYKCWYCNKNYQKRMVKITKRICQYIQIRLNTHKKNLLRFWNKRFRWMEWYTVINWRV